MRILGSATRPWGPHFIMRFIRARLRFVRDSSGNGFIPLVRASVAIPFRGGCFFPSHGLQPRA